MPPSAGMIRWGDQCARTGPWRADTSVALLTPVTEAPAPSPAFVRRCLSLLAESGFQGVVTAALAPEEQGGFLEAGFAVHERLHLLVLDKSVQLPPTPRGVPLHRAGRRWVAGTLRVDGASFTPFWRLDRAGLREALAATPQRRFRVALGDEASGGRKVLVRRSVLGYAICGCAGGRGFVQRLAVAPAVQGRGVGRRLLLDGLHWLRRAGTWQVAVNTQMGNDAALSLYRSVGFREDPKGLSVLWADLRREVPAMAPAREGGLASAGGEVAP